MTGQQVGVAGVLLPESMPEDPLTHARTYAGRKILRMLDRTTAVPFVAAAEAYRRYPLAEPARVALFTVSAWDPFPPEPAEDPAADGGDPVAALTSFYLRPPNPSGYWLHRMPNNPLCHVSIACGFRGPNTHFVGDAGSFRDACAIGAHEISRGLAGMGLIVAYDDSRGDDHAPPGEGDTAAGAVVLGPAPDGAGLAAALDVLSTCPAGTSALDAVRAVAAGMPTLAYPDRVEGRA